MILFHPEDPVSNTGYFNNSVSELEKKNNNKDPGGKKESHQFIQNHFSFEFIPLLRCLLFLVSSYSQPLVPTMCFICINPFLSSYNLCCCSVVVFFFLIYVHYPALILLAVFSLHCFSSLFAGTQLDHLVTPVSVPDSFVLHLMQEDSDNSHTYCLGGDIAVWICLTGVMGLSVPTQHQ